MLYNIHLQLFAEGGGEAGGEGQNAAGDGFAAQFEKQFGHKPGAAAPEARAQKAEPKEEKKQTDGDAGQDAAAEQPHQAEDPDAEFEQLIKGKFKDAYGKRAQAMINDRFKNHNAELEKLRAENQALKDAYDPYARTLGVDLNDTEAVKQAVLNDSRNFRADAMKKNITVEQAIADYQQQRQSERDAEEMQRRKDEIQQRQQEEQSRQIFEGWEAEAEDIKRTDAEFDLKTEIKNNAEFRNMLNAGVSVRNAYRATHYESNMAKVAGAVERQTALNTAQSISAGQQRPAEGGLTPNAAARQTRKDYKNLSKNEVMNIFNESLKGR